MKKRRYFDNAATSFPKAPGVPEAVAAYLSQEGGSPGRGTYLAAQSAAETVLSVREALDRLFHGPGPRNVILTPGCTYALNYVIKGLLRPGDRAAFSCGEHNAVYRPLSQMAERGVELVELPWRDGAVDLEAAERLLRPDIRLLVCCHASNVTGALQPVSRLGELCRERGIFFCVDGAQTAGAVPIDMAAMHIDALAVPAHKGLLGPQGLGALLITDQMAAQLDPLIAGGTGSQSERAEMPGLLPDRFEAGTQDLPAVCGLKAALEWGESQGWEELYRREKRLTGHLIARLREMEPDGLRLFGPLDREKQVGIVSVDFPGMDGAEAAFRLEREHGIACRCGLHCAPLAHRALGTFPAGTVRFSVSALSRYEDIDYLQAAVCDVMGI